MRKPFSGSEENQTMAVRLKRQSQTCTRIAEVPRFMAPTDKLVNPQDASKGPDEMVSVYQDYTKDIWIPERVPDDSMKLSPPVTPPASTGDLTDRLAADVRA